MARTAWARVQVVAITVFATHTWAGVFGVFGEAWDQGIVQSALMSVIELLLISSLDLTIFGTAAAATVLLAFSSRTRLWAAWPFGLSLVVTCGFGGALVGELLRYAAQYPRAFICGTPYVLTFQVIVLQVGFAVVFALVLLAFPRTHQVGAILLLKILPACVVVAPAGGLSHSLLRIEL